MAETKIVRNTYCTDPKDRVVPWSCPCCSKCWLFVAGPRKGACAFGGPFQGYEHLASAPATPTREGDR